ncbi:MAG: DUF3108 domain-containing protein [Candidatus Omnitrophica bacterium]|nr:DUF3108 domain-containing protein [Candidatus Omnitrophota bacterium]
MRPSLTAYCLLLTAVFLAGCARFQIFPGKKAEVSLPGLEAVSVPEDLKYRVYWWGVPVGLVSLAALPEGKSGSEKKLLRFTLEARSAWGLETFYRVRVKLTSLYDPQARRPKHFEASVKRRWRLHESEILFDSDKGEAFHRLPKNRSTTVAVGPQTQDGLSLLYHIRGLPLRVGEDVPLQVTADGKNWDLKGEVLRITEIKVGALGRHLAVEGQAQLAYPVPFFHGAKARVFFSADQRRVPLLARIHSRIGPVTVVLTKREGS